MPPEEVPPVAALEGGEPGPDRELAAIKTVVAALLPLTTEERDRVIAYVFARLGLTQQTPNVPGGATPSAIPAAPRATDVRSLGEQKKPRTAIEMAAVVAYYLSELAPSDQRRNEVAVADIEKYFKQANFPLPERPSVTLVHAKNAGYFDAGSGRGLYKLNPVGYNLVAHNLPPAGAQATLPTIKRPSRTKTRGK